MLRPGSSIVSSPDGQEFTNFMYKERPRPWQKLIRWAREHPATAALASLVVAGMVVAVIVGPIVGLQRNRAKEDDVTSTSSQELVLTFQTRAQNTPQLCASLSNQVASAASTAALQFKIAQLLNVASSQVQLQSVQCGSDTVSSTLSIRRLTQEQASGLALTLVFELLAPHNDNGSGNATAPSLPLPQLSEVETVLQSAASRTLVQETLSQILGLPNSSVILTNVKATVRTAISTPPSSSPPAQRPAPPVVPQSSWVSTPSPPYGGSGGSYMPSTYLPGGGSGGSYMPATYLPDASHPYIPVYGMHPPMEMAPPIYEKGGRLDD